MGTRHSLGCLLGCLLFLVLAGGVRGGEKPAGGIVSLAPSITETLFAMGLGEQVAGTTEFSDYPPAAKSIPRIGRFLDPEPERIIALCPRVCIGLIGSTPPQLVRLLEKFDIPTLLVDVSRMDTMLASIERMAAYLGHGEAGTRLREAYAARLKRLEVRVLGLERPRVLTVVSVSPLYCAGPESFVADAVRCAGGEPVGMDDGKAWQGVSREAFLSLAPDIILFAAHGTPVPDWMRKPPFGGAQIVSIDPAFVIRPSPRLIDASEELAGVFHPGN